ncbi:exported hypothetical protein [Stenotrophomonas maltophilia]|nr:exported hypothetical protein [Stenotrophomonas maltophilia]
MNFQRFKTMADFKPLRGNPAFVTLTLLFAALLVANNANAEGRCPAGQYPIGDQGVGGVPPSLERGGAPVGRNPLASGIRRGVPLLPRPARTKQAWRQGGLRKRMRSVSLSRDAACALLATAEYSSRTGTSVRLGSFLRAKAMGRVVALRAVKT